jgi:asparagine synthase (glutamine-hydrolysing)
MARNSGNPVVTNTIGFPSKAHDETEYARRTAALFKTRHHEAQVTPEAVSVLEKLAWHYDEPFADASMVPTYYVCEMARKSVTVALSGDGGDESFAGYRRYFYDLLENRVRGVVPAAVRAPLFGLLGGVYPKADWLPQPLRAKTLLKNLSYSPARGYFTSMSHTSPSQKRKLLSGEATAKLGGYDPCSVFEAHMAACSSKDPLSRIQYLDVKTYLVDDILTKVDRASMAVSLEVRVPLLDHRVLELAARMPSGWKLKGRESKHVFKESLRKVLPAEIFARRKTGFSMPVKEWLAGDLHGYLREALTGPKGLDKTGLFEAPALEKMMKEHASGIRNHDYALFTLLSLALWNRNFRVL